MTGTGWGGLRAGAGRPRLDMRCACGEMTLQRAEERKHTCVSPEGWEWTSPLKPYEFETVHGAMINQGVEIKEIFQTGSGIDSRTRICWREKRER